MKFKTILCLLSFVLCPIFADYQPDGLFNLIDTKHKVVTLTFDDGPLPEITDQILDILAKEKVKANFFMIGINILKHPEIVKRIYYEGHDIGNHTFHHLRLDTMYGSQLEFEINETNRIFENLLGFAPTIFRPPGGRYNNLVDKYVSKEKMIPVGWTINTNDFLYKKEKISQKKLDAKVARALAIVKKKLQPGAIILMHNGSEVSVAALPKVIKLIKKNGYTFKKLSEVKLVRP